jgi:hypothetical protein
MATRFPPMQTSAIRHTHTTTLWTLYRGSEVAECRTLASDDIEAQMLVNGEGQVLVNGVETMRIEGTLEEIARFAVDQRRAFEAVGWDRDRVH